MMIIRIVLYKDHFDVYATSPGDITVRTVLNRRDVSGSFLSGECNFIADFGASRITGRKFGTMCSRNDCTGKQMFS
jgi:hypothetical protein